MIVLMSKYIEQQQSFSGFSPNWCCKILSLFDVMTRKLPQRLLPTVARCIPVLSSRYMGKCTPLVLKRSGVL